MANFYTEKMNEEIQSLAKYLTWSEDDDHYPQEEHALQRIKEFAYKIRNQAHTEIAHELYQIKQKWQNMGDNHAPIVMDILIEMIERKGEKNLDVFREALRELGGLPQVQAKEIT